VGEMLTYAHDTQHEKIIRGLAIGCALVMYGREEEADPMIEQLCQDADPILRYGAWHQPHRWGSRLGVWARPPAQSTPS
jgi:26S proteasome regulatory subunit N2